PPALIMVPEAKFLTVVKASITDILTSAQLDLCNRGRVITIFASSRNARIVFRYLSIRKPTLPPRQMEKGTVSMHQPSIASTRTIPTFRSISGRLLEIWTQQCASNATATDRRAMRSGASTGNICWGAARRIKVNIITARNGSLLSPVGGSDSAAGERASVYADRDWTCGRHHSPLLLRATMIQCFPRGFTESESGLAVPVSRA